MAETTKRILLVDDCEVTLVVEKVMLESRGYRVETISALSEFDAAVESFRPDVVLTDVRMPGASGMDLCRHLKASAPGLPVVLVSAMGEEELSTYANASGADGYLSKADGLEALGEKMDALVRMLWMMG